MVLMYYAFIVDHGLQSCPWKSEI